MQKASPASSCDSAPPAGMGTPRRKRGLARLLSVIPVTAEQAPGAAGGAPGRRHCHCGQTPPTLNTQEGHHPPCYFLFPFRGRFSPGFPACTSRFLNWLTWSERPAHRGLSLSCPQASPRPRACLPPHLLEQHELVLGSRPPVDFVLVPVGMPGLGRWPGLTGPLTRPGKPLRGEGGQCAGQRGWGVLGQRGQPGKEAFLEEGTSYPSWENGDR